MELIDSIAYSPHRTFVSSLQDNVTLTRARAQGSTKLTLTSPNSDTASLQLLQKLNHTQISTSFDDCQVTIKTPFHITLDKYHGNNIATISKSEFCKPTSQLTARSSLTTDQILSSMPDN